MRKIKRVLNLFFETMTFILTLYMISCFMISFQDIKKVIIMIINICIISMFYNISKENYGKKKEILLVLFLFVTLIFIIYKFGYFNISNKLSYF